MPFDGRPPGESRSPAAALVRELCNRQPIRRRSTPRPNVNEPSASPEVPTYPTSPRRARTKVVPPQAFTPEVGPRWSPGWIPRMGADTPRIATRCPHRLWENRALTAMERAGFRRADPREGAVDPRKIGSPARQLARAPPLAGLASWALVGLVGRRAAGPVKGAASTLPWSDARPHHRSRRAPCRPPCRPPPPPRPWRRSSR